MSFVIFGYRVRILSGKNRTCIEGTRENFQTFNFYSQAAANSTSHDLSPQLDIIL